MPRRLSTGQRAAVGAARARRGELKLNQKQLAKAAGVSERTVSMFEAGHTWPRADTLAQIERLGLNWPVGYLAEYAATHEDRHQAAATIQDEISAIVNSDMADDLKSRLIARLQAIESERLREQLDELERRTTPHQSPGEELEGDRRSA